MDTVEAIKLGPSAATVARKLKGEILAGRIAPGDLLPSARKLAKVYAIDSKTAWRALKGLESEGLVAAESARGFRVLPGACDPARDCPVIYLLGDAKPEELDRSGNDLRQSLQDAASRRGWSLLTIGAGGMDSDQVMKQLKKLRASGVVTDTEDPELIDALTASGMPTVAVDVGAENSSHDSIMQDGQGGGLLAVRYLVGRGHKRISWFGSGRRTRHLLDRVGGVYAGLFEAGIDPALAIQLSVNAEEAETQAFQMLSRRDRPKAIACLWNFTTLATKRAADRLGLRLGRDFDMVGWSTAESYGSGYQSSFRSGQVPPTVVWSTRTMAETAVSRMAERRENPNLEPLMVKIPTRLVLPNK